jgi:hypothetical protein
MDPLKRIVRASIHPAIGIARVGNSAEEFFVGPEVPEEPALPAGRYKDATGALLRQAARFRIYGYDAAGEVVCELNSRNAEVSWTVHVANKKGAWYEFQLALDIPEAKLPGAAVSRRRNPQSVGGDRQRLIIDPGARTIAGANQSGGEYQFDGGTFLEVPVHLGELRTDEEGRLLFLGGRGRSASIANEAPLDFANNDGWYDDTSDGPVEATVKIGRREIPVEGAWVSVAPPNYAPALKTVRTMHDVLYDRALAWGQTTAPAQLTFCRHIEPIFARLSGLQWVNSGFASVFGVGAPYDIETLRERLADQSPDNAEFRQAIFAQFRNPATGNLGKWLWPFYYGDGLDSLTTAVPDSSETEVRGLASLSATQLSRLQSWAGGTVENDLASPPAVYPSLAKTPVAEQPAALDQAALDFCLADAFHPGCELTWIVRARSLYRSRLRIRRRPALMPEPDYGEILTWDVATSRTGPLSGSGPGDLTRWMAVPWQTDTGSCLQGYPFFNTTPSLPTFWPARVPNEVLRVEDYQIAINAKKPLEERIAAFRRRSGWYRDFDGPDYRAQMVRDFYKLGIIEEQPGAKAGAELPGRMWVESKPELPEKPAAAAAAGVKRPVPKSAYGARRVGQRPPPL